MWNFWQFFPNFFAAIFQHICVCVYCTWCQEERATAVTSETQRLLLCYRKKSILYCESIPHQQFVIYHSAVFKNRAINTFANLPGSVCAHKFSLISDYLIFRDVMMEGWWLGHVLQPRDTRTWETCSQHGNNGLHSWSEIASSNRKMILWDLQHPTKCLWRVFTSMLTGASDQY